MTKITFDAPEGVGYYDDRREKVVFLKRRRNGKLRLDRVPRRWLKDSARVPFDVWMTRRFRRLGV